MFIRVRCLYICNIQHLFDIIYLPYTLGVSPLHAQCRTYVIKYTVVITYTLLA